MVITATIVVVIIDVAIDINSSNYHMITIIIIILIIIKTTIVTAIIRVAVPPPPRPLSQLPLLLDSFPPFKKSPGKGKAAADETRRRAQERRAGSLRVCTHACMHACMQVRTYVGAFCSQTLVPPSFPHTHHLVVLPV